MTENNKALLKKILIFLSIFSGMLFLAVLAYGLLVERQVSINMEKSLGQAKTIDLSIPIDKKEILIDKKKEELDKAIKELTAPQPQQQTGQDELDVKEEKPAPKVAIVVTNLGTNKTLTEDAIKLPKKITLGFSAYTTSLRPMFDKAVSSGHDVLIYLPFEPKDYPLSDPGPYAILDENPVDKNIATVNSIIETFQGIKGVYGNYRESFSSNQKAFLPVMDFILQKNMLIFLGRNIANDSPNFLSNRENVIGGDVVLDLIPDETAIKHSLNSLASIAKTKGFAVGYINTYPISIKALNEWILSPASSEVEIVPISEISGPGR